MGVTGEAAIPVMLPEEGVRLRAEAPWLFPNSVELLLDRVTSKAAAVADAADRRTATLSKMSNTAGSVGIRCSIRRIFS